MSAIETIKITDGGSKQMVFNGVEFWANCYNRITWVPSGEWEIVDRLVDAGLATRTFHKECYGHEIYTINVGADNAN